MADEKTGRQTQANDAKATDKQAQDAAQTFLKTGKLPAGVKSIRFESRGGQSVPVIEK